MHRKAFGFVIVAAAFLLAFSGIPSAASAQVPVNAAAIKRISDARYSQPLPQRLKGAAVSPRAQNFLSAVPLITPPAWAGSTAYLAGPVVSSGGNMYQCIVPGTSASSGGLSGTSYTTSVTDGTASWMYRGAVSPSASDIDAPTETIWNGTVSGVTNSVLIKVATGRLNPSTVNIRDCGYAVLDKFQNLYGVCSTYATGSVNPNINGAVPGIAQSHVRYEFVTDAIAFAPAITTQCEAKVFINDRPVEVGGTQLGSSASGTNGTTFAFATRAFRKVAIELPQGISLAGIYIGQSDTIYAPNDPYPVRACFVTDSYGIGGNGFPLVAGRYVATLAGQALGWTDVVASGVSGTGITNTGPSNQGNFITRVTTDVAGNYLTIPTSVTGSTSTAIQTGNTIAITCGALSSTPFIGQQITLAGLTPSSLNGTYQVAQGTSPSTTAFSLTSPVYQSVTATVQGTIALDYTNFNTFSGVAWKPYDVINLMLSVNDAGVAAATEASNAVALYQAVRAANPNAVITLVGLVTNASLASSPGIGTPVNGSFLGATTTTTGYIEAFTEQQVAAAAAAAGDTRFFAMPMTAITDQTGHNSIDSIFQGLGYTGFGNPVGSPSDITGNNSRLMAFGGPPAGVHPTDLGAQLWATSYANWFKASVLPNLNGQSPVWILVGVSACLGQARRRRLRSKEAARNNRAFSV